MKDKDGLPKIGVIGLKGLPAFGGAATVGENIIKQLRGNFQFRVYAIKSHTQELEYKPDGLNKQVLFRKFPIGKLNVFAYYIKSAFHALFKEKYDLVHLHHIDGAFILPLLKLKYKVICTSHARPQIAEKWPWYVKFFFSINERITFIFADLVTTVAIPLKDIYSSLTSKVITYIPNGIDVELKPTDKEIEYNGYLLFAAGRIIPLKGLHILLKSLQKIKYKGKLLVLGDLDQMPAYKEELLGLASNLDVEFLGMIKEKGLLLKYITNSKLFIFPSYSENMSIMLLEVASMKTPLVVSNIPENCAIFDSSEALFFKTNDVEDLSEKVKYALSNEREMKEKTELAYKRLLTDFTWAKVSKRYASLYKGLINK